ncbi:DNA helicase [Salvia divinorum]|uniref:DNA helicase n=1 Tax=Salvia divinorum TaxID=28513 RepID=A0ABD1FL96_SALDI
MTPYVAMRKLMSYVGCYRMIKKISASNTQIFIKSNVMPLLVMVRYAYYASHSLAYNHIFNTTIREGQKVNLCGSIIIFDEAHNIEDIARESGSIDIEEESLFDLLTELRQLRLSDTMIYLPLLEMIEGILKWMNRKNTVLNSERLNHWFC